MHLPLVSFREWNCGLVRDLIQCWKISLVVLAKGNRLVQTSGFLIPQVTFP